MTKTAIPAMSTEEEKRAFEEYVGRGLLQAAARVVGVVVAASKLSSSAGKATTSAADQLAWLVWGRRTPTTRAAAFRVQP
jgi:hypothetical protein